MSLLVGVILAITHAKSWENFMEPSKQNLVKCGLAGRQFLLMKAVFHTKVGKVHDNVLNMLVPFAHLGYSVYMDNFYTSPFLFPSLENMEYPCNWYKQE